jgi:hypothetical protein
MPKALLLATLLLIVRTAHAQTTLPNDSTFFMAEVLHTTALYQQPSLASDELKSLEAGKKLAVISYHNDALEYLFVITDTLTGYVLLSDVFILENRLEYLKSRRREGETLRYEQAQSTASFITEEENKQLRKDVVRYKKQGLVVREWSFTEPDDVVGGVDVSFRILNPSPKTIKYIWVSVVAYNPVGDRTGDRIHGLKPVPLKGIGPISQWEGGAWEFENVWYNQTIDCVRIALIKVQYMDGSIRIFDKPNLTMDVDQLNSCKY